MTEGFLIPRAAFVRTAAFTLFAYDFALTLDEEIALVWRNRWTRATLVYMLIRYVTLIVLIIDLYMGIRVHLSREVCTTFGITASALSVLVISLVQAVFQLRLYLIYNRRRLIMWTNITFFVVQLALWIILFAVVKSTPIRIQLPPNIIGSCYRWQDPLRTAMGWVPSLAFELWMAGLAVYKLWHEPRVTSGPSILPHLVYDSIVYFVFVCGAMIAMIALYLTNPVDPGVAASGLMTTVTGIGGTRVILNMRHLLLSPSTNHIDVPGIETLPVATPGRSDARAGHTIELEIVNDTNTFDSTLDQNHTRQSSNSIAV